MWRRLEGFNLLCFDIEGNSHLCEMRREIEFERHEEGNLFN